MASSTNRSQQANPAQGQHRPTPKTRRHPTNRSQQADPAQGSDLANSADVQRNRVMMVITDVVTVSSLIGLLANVIQTDAGLLLAVVTIALLGFALLIWLIMKGVDTRGGLGMWSTILVVSIAIGIVPWLFLAGKQVTPTEVRITAPVDGAEIDQYRHVVMGTVSDPAANVRVIVRPTKTLEYWVQEPPTVDGAGNWQVNAYLGTVGDGIGEDFEIIALATNENFIVKWLTGNQLQFGKTSDLPNNTNRSNLITVRRVR